MGEVTCIKHHQEAKSIKFQAERFYKKAKELEEDARAMQEITLRGINNDVDCRDLYNQVALFLSMARSYKISALELRRVQQ